MTPRVIGVLGGLGPWATLDLFEKILRLTPAERDQDHLRVIIDNNPRVPDRGPAILGEGEDPTPALVEGARTLERAGADFIVIPCNTAHYFHASIQAAVGIPVLHIMEEVAAAARAEVPQVRTLGLLATPATVASRLYHHACGGVGREVIAPDAAGQEVVTAAIYAVKAGRRDRRLTGDLLAVVRDLVSRGAGAIILGCTELPLVLDARDLPVPLLDSNLILARAAVRRALGDPVPSASRP
ncbi:MAG: amino acid racemase [Armatimonadota bacterium]|nr:amino acid racemase [Armatimonadota bacterium]MDR7402615.1 amino acid racemase [Armatimonadota bacterium]MDR7404538.1 amino acid racemase [Armatimonadota bacterium]MDR7436783.1 amino acid racemase [Armatimonadota bacterium]MDR7472730.1 amino acid racemase [Armatimonadota bacterium]